MLGKKLKTVFAWNLIIFIGVPFLAVSQNKGLLFDDAAFKRNVPKQYIGPAFQDEVLPKKVTLRSYCPISQNQGQMGSCVGWAVGYGAYTISDAIRKGIKDKVVITSNAFSALYIYNQIKISDCSHGAYIHDALTFSKQKGNCSLSQFNPSSCFGKPSSELETLRIKDSQALFYGSETQNVRLYAVKQKLKDSIPVVIGFETNSQFSPSFITPSNSVWIGGGKNDGGHAVVIVGYDDDKRMFEVLNSWGTSFGDSGFFWMTYSDFLLYTRYAAILTLPEVKTNQFLNEGKVTLTYFDKNTNKLEDVNLQKLGGYLYRTAKSKWELGNIFQLIVSSLSKGQYVYVFSIDETGRPHIHFPRRQEYGNVNVNDVLTTNDSPLFTESQASVFIPNEKTGMKLNTKDEILCILFSRSGLQNFRELTVSISNNYFRNKNLSKALEESLATQLVPFGNIEYSNNHGFFKALVKPYNIIPIAIKLEADQ